MTRQSVTIAVLPLGAHEQHGPHLPFETDALIAGAVAERLAKAATDDITVEVLPVEPVGYSIEHMDIDGTRTLSFDEAINRWIGIAGDVRNAA
jgi:creatinine amidohydrolase